MDIEDIVDGGLENCDARQIDDVLIANDEVIEHAFSRPAELRIANNAVKY